MSALTPDETILGLLAAQSQHGYQLLEVFHNPQQLGNVWHLSTSQLYAVLKRLERQEWIVGCEQTSENAPSRIEYSITPQGFNVLDAWLNDTTPFASIRRVRVEFLSRLFIARELSLPTAEIIERQREACLHERQRLFVDSQITTPGMEMLTIEFVIGQLDAVLHWIAHCDLTTAGIE